MESFTAIKKIIKKIATCVYQIDVQDMLLNGKTEIHYYSPNRKLPRLKHAHTSVPNKMQCVFRTRR